jgi:hypothetical protein
VVPLTVATEYDEHKLIVPRLDPASLGFSGTTTIFHPLSNVFRSQLFDVDHGCLIIPLTLVEPAKAVHVVDELINDGLHLVQ